MPSTPSPTRSRRAVRTGRSSGSSSAPSVNSPTRGITASEEDIHFWAIVEVGVPREVGPIRSARACPSRVPGDANVSIAGMHRVPGVRGGMPGPGHAGAVDKQAVPLARLSDRDRDRSSVPRAHRTRSRDWSLAHGDRPACLLRARPACCGIPASASSGRLRGWSSASPARPLRVGAVGNAFGQGRLPHFEGERPRWGA